MKWYRLAAEQGFASAQGALGAMYAFGMGVQKDYVYGHMWADIAASKGNERGGKLRDHTAKQMTSVQIAKAKNLYRRCIRKKYKGCMKSSSKTSQFAKKTPSKSAAEKENERLRQENIRLENERLRRENARLKKEKQSRPKQVAKKPPPKKAPQPKSGSTGSGFFVSKLGHIITNEHVVRKCGSVTVGDNTNNQVSASVLEKDKRNDLALLRISSTKMASAETKSLISKLNVQKLGLKLVPLASEGLVRSDDVELGEDVLVAGYPYGELFSDTIKVTKGIVSANKGMGDDRGQFQMDAAVQSGNSGGPIYDENGNIVGVVVSQLDPLKVAKTIGSLPQNVNFGIKASTVRQFLTSAGLPTKWSNRTKRKSTKELAQIAKNQTVMVVCNP